jgi:hypothetical protein
MKEGYDVRLRVTVGSLMPSLLVLITHLALVAIIYWPTLQLGFVSDSWVYLARLRTSVWDTLTTPTGYHYQPVACAWVALIRACFGESPAAFQAVLILQLALFSYLTYQLGRRLLPDPGIAFLGSLLVTGSAAFYETTYWALAGNMHLLAAKLYVLAVILAVDLAGGRRVRSGPWLLGLTVLAAIFTHPAMVTAVPVCAVTLFLADPDVRRSLRPGEARARKLKALLVLAAVIVPFALSRLAFAAHFDLGPRPGIGRMQAYWLVSRGLVAVFSLRGSHDVVHWLMTFGTFADFSSFHIWLFVAGWLGVAALAGAFCFWQTRTPGIRVLIAALTIHIVIAAIAGGMSSRQSHLPALFAGLLTAWAFYAVAGWLARTGAAAPVVAISRQLPAVGVALLIVAAASDHRISADLHVRAGNLSRALIEQIRILAPSDRGRVNLTLVNMPGYSIDRGFGAATFANGLHELTRLTSPAVDTLQLCRISIAGAPPDFAAGSVLVSPDELRSRLLEPSRVTLLFQAPSEFRILTPERLDAVAPR